MVTDVEQEALVGTIREKLATLRGRLDGKSANYMELLGSLVQENDWPLFNALKDINIAVANRSFCSYVRSLDFIVAVSKTLEYGSLDRVFVEALERKDFPFATKLLTELDYSPNLRVIYQAVVKKSKEEREEIATLLTECEGVKVRKFLETLSNREK